MSKKSTAIKPKMPPCPRTRWIGFILYQDNCYHMQMLDYFKVRNYDMCFILHDKDKNTDGTPKKAHYHLMVRFDTPRTASGYASDTYYGWFVEKPVIGDDDKEKFVYTAVSGQDLELARSRGDKVVKKPLFRYGGESSTVFSIHHPEEYYHYLPHRTFMCEIEGKVKYSYSDIQYFGDVEKMKSLASTEHDNHVDTIQQIYGYFREYRTCTAVMEKLIEHGRFDLVAYCEGHALFLKHFMSKGGES